jgi:hypothetical protein
MFRLIHTQNDWKGSMCLRRGNRLFRRMPGTTITIMVQTGKQVTQ